MEEGRTLTRFHAQTAATFGEAASEGTNTIITSGTQRRIILRFRRYALYVTAKGIAPKRTQRTAFMGTNILSKIPTGSQMALGIA